MSRYGRYGGETKVYVGNLGTGAGKGELERAFSYYGPLRTVWIARNPPGFAFVEFEDPRDAEDAVRGLDGKVICGSRVRVELSTGMPRRSRYDRPPARRPFDPNDRCYECGEKGHYAYDCHRYSRRRRSRSRSRSHSRSRGRRYSRSRSRSRGRRSRSASLRRSRSVSPRRSRSASPRRSRSGSLKKSRSRSRSRSRSVTWPRSSFTGHLRFRSVMVNKRQSFGLGPMVDLNLAHLLKANQSPDPPLQREVVHHQEALKGGVQVL
ncbi:serine/arginine-rich splicing factor 7 isoform X2 [Gopherus evgoodei]|uniref:serine/arginine-rich splicing factor 7 isoform X2 n=1 Tax=Gopherus evgoodei TaxID=1825980 RepID=UPI0011CED767|nr:serine/arginine-rich splicing factor 7 isoform X2 [Gopherus evgoodei]